VRALTSPVLRSSLGLYRTQGHSATRAAAVPPSLSCIPSQAAQATRTLCKPLPSLHKPVMLHALRRQCWLGHLHCHQRLLQSRPCLRPPQAASTHVQPPAPGAAAPPAPATSRQQQLHREQAAYRRHGSATLQRVPQLPAGCRGTPPTRAALLPAAAWPPPGSWPWCPATLTVRRSAEAGALRALATAASALAASPMAAEKHSGGTPVCHVAASATSACPPPAVPCSGSRFIVFEPCVSPCPLAALVRLPTRSFILLLQCAAH
jgi:hypothetical protein